MTMNTSPKLKVTKDYDLFETHEFNRPLHRNPQLLESMKKHGFMPSSPIQCVRSGNGKLKVIRGHHRLDIAKRLGLKVWYVVDDTNTDIFDLEGGYQQWNALDFCVARAKAGDAACEEILRFKEIHKLTIGSVTSLLGGESAGSFNKMAAMKKGKFKIKDTKHAYDVVEITDLCLKLGIPFATSAAFVAAVSLACRVHVFDREKFKKRLALDSARMRRRSTRNDYLEEIETLYNHGARDKRIQVKFLALESAKSRSKRSKAEPQEEQAHAEP